MTYSVTKGEHLLRPSARTREGRLEREVPLSIALRENSEPHTTPVVEGDPTPNTQVSWT